MLKKGFFMLLLAFNGTLCAFQTSLRVPSFFADALIWQAQVVSDDNWGQLLGPTGSNQENTLLRASFDWRPGLRVGVGYNGQNNLWNALFYYTGYATDGKAQASTDSGEVHSAFLGNFFAENLNGDGLSGPYYKYGAIDWNVNLHTLDLELGRMLAVHPRLHIRPFAGVKLGSLRQTIRTNWQQPFNNQTKTPITSFTEAHETVSNVFKGIGPSLGMDTHWQLYQNHVSGMRLTGDVSAAFLLGRWIISDVYENNTPVQIHIQNDKMTSISSIMRVYIGLEYTHTFNRLDVAMGIGYEDQVWFNQLRYYSFDMGRTNDSIFFHGGVFNVRFQA